MSRIAAGLALPCIRLLAMVLLSLSVGCSTVRAPSPADPFEGFNRSVDTLNQKLDKFILKPVAQTYVAVLPGFMRQGVNNFFDNIADAITSVNNLLQAKPKEAASDAARVLINTTVGVLGLFDVATDMGFQRHDEDFGQTFGRWGVGPGPYLVLPFYGPSTVRDAAGLIVNFQVDPVSNLDDNTTRNALSGGRIVDRRAELLDLSDSLEGVALDNYAFVRDAFLARRRSKVYDGDPPPEKFLDETEPEPAQ
jgi:phospholipid-binding lipoprotein MlaA